jgi:hypothetical protein
MSDKTVAQMSEREQIERLIQQRNALWKLIEQFALEDDSDENAERYDGLWKRCGDIVKSVYWVEGISPATGEIDLAKDKVKEAHAPYFQAAGKPWR